MPSLSRLAFVGGGVMAEAMIRGVLNASLLTPDQVRVSDPDEGRRDHLHSTYAVRTSAVNRNVLAGADVVVLAIKPQQVDPVIRELKGALREEQLILSVMARVTIETIAMGLAHPAVVRAIPNTPAQVGAAVTAWIAADAVDALGRARAASLLGAFGRAVELDDEE